MPFNKTMTHESNMTSKMKQSIYNKNRVKTQTVIQRPPSSLMTDFFRVLGREHFFRISLIRYEFRLIGFQYKYWTSNGNQKEKKGKKTLHNKVNLQVLSIHCVSLESVSGGNIVSLNFGFLLSISLADLTAALLVLSSLIS